MIPSRVDMREKPRAKMGAGGRDDFTKVGCKGGRSVPVDERKDTEM